MIKVDREDALRLCDSITETEASRELYEEATKRADCTPEAVKVIMDYFMHCLKEHKALWRDMLVKYVGENAASEKYNVLRFDKIKWVIFEVASCRLS